LISSGVRKSWMLTPLALRAPRRPTSALAASRESREKKTPVEAACEPRSMASEMDKGAPGSVSTRKDVSRSLREAAESGSEPGGALSTKLRRM
jgi:hypothetical protein